MQTLTVLDSLCDDRDEGMPQTELVARLRRFVATASCAPGCPGLDPDSPRPCRCGHQAALAGLHTSPWGRLLRGLPD